MSRRTVLLILTIAVLMVIAGSVIAMVSYEPSKPQSDQSIVIYRGRQLHCIALTGNYNGARVCDFDRFYHDNPDLAS